MELDIIERICAQIDRTRTVDPLGRVAEIEGGLVALSGLNDKARLGDPIEIALPDRCCHAEVVRITSDRVEALPEGDISGIAMGMQARLRQAVFFAPHTSWIGRIIDPDGTPIDGKPLVPGLEERRLQAPPIGAQTRRAFGARIATGLAVFDTLLPIVRGQRLGLFAGSGVGKSSLLGELARSVEADVIVIGLVGERGRELRDFVEKTLGVDGMARSVVIAATSDRAPQTRRRCAFAAMSVAEYFRDQGKHVLLLMDSVTRFAEAHRELAVASGEAANLRGFPASTGPAIAGLCERAGPGGPGQGDITAIFSVLVAGSDMEEPVADMLRGVLDGHVVLDREIAERGRFPAIDLLRSVSRSLPDAASPEENDLITESRRQLGLYDRSELMIQSGLYAAGSDPQLDRAIQIAPRLDQFISLREPGGPEASFAALRCVLQAS